MQTETQIQAIVEKINELLKDHPSHFLVDVRIKPTDNIKVFLDADEGMPLSELISYNRRLRKVLEETGMYAEGEYSLEVSSPGLDEPLKMNRQYKKNIGRKVEVTLKDGTRTDGVLKQVDESSITIEETKGKNKKKEIIQHIFSFESIKTTKIQIVF